MSYREIRLDEKLAVSYIRENFDIYKDFLNIVEYFYDKAAAGSSFKTYWSDKYDYTIKNCLHGYLNDPVLAKQARDWGVKKIYDFVHSDIGNLALFPDLMFHTGSDELERFGKYITIENRDHCYLIDSASDFKQIETAISLCSDCQFSVGFFVNSNKKIANKIDIDKQFLYNFTLKKIVLGAYDEEGFIVISYK